MDKTEIVETVKSDNFKHTLVKLAVATVASTLARKAAEELVDWMHNRRQTVTIETVAE
jgi:hypothetical protein